LVSLYGVSEKPIPVLRSLIVKGKIQPRVVRPTAGADVGSLRHLSPGGDQEQARLSLNVPDLASADGLYLTEAFMQISNAKLRRAVVNLIEQIADA
jgi:hypothetical protein